MNTTKAAGFFWLIAFLTGLLSLMIYRGIIVGGNAARLMGIGV